MADEYNKFAPGVWEGLSSLPDQILGENTNKAVGNFIERPVQTTYSGLEKLINAVLPNYQFTPQDIANRVAGTVERGGIVPSEKQNSPVTGFSPATTAALTETSAIPVTETGAGGGALPTTAQTPAKTQYKFEEPAPTGTMMAGTGIPGIYRMPDGSYTNVSGPAQTPQQLAADRLNNAIATISRDIATLPSTGVHAPDAAVREKDLTALAQFANLLKPQQTVATPGAQVVSVDSTGKPTVIADNTGAYLQHQKMATDAVAGKAQDAEKMQLHKERVRQASDLYKNYNTEFEKISNSMSNPADEYREKRALTKKYFMQLGMPEAEASVPQTVENFIHEQQQAYKLAGKKWTQETEAKSREFYEKVAKPRFDKVHAAIMAKIHGTGK